MPGGDNDSRPGRRRAHEEPGLDAVQFGGRVHRGGVEYVSGEPPTRRIGGECEGLTG